MSTFAIQLQEFAAKAKDRADDVVGLTVINIAKRLDERSPVGDPSKWKDWKVGEKNEDHWLVKAEFAGEGYVGGRFRGNWQLGVGSIPSGETERIDPDGAATVGAIVAEMPKDAAGKVYYLANNVPYAQRLEDGYSTQAPAGIVGLTVVEFETIVREAVGALP
jgi:hypothetical protein